MDRIEEYESVPVPLSARKSTTHVSAVWFGFPMVVTNTVIGGLLGWNLGFWPAVAAILLGNLILFAYVGLLSYIAGNTGLNFALLAQRSFGKKGYRFAAAFLSIVVIGWYAFQVGLTGKMLSGLFDLNINAVVIVATVLYTAITFFGVRALAWIGFISVPFFLIIVGFSLYGLHQQEGIMQATHATGHPDGITFFIALSMLVAGWADSGTMTPDFTRWAKDGRSAVIAAFSAFPIGNGVALLAGALFACSGLIPDPGHNGGDFLPVFLHQYPHIGWVAILFVFINLGSVCSHCLYNGAVGMSNLFGQPMRRMSVILGLLGGALALAGAWSYFLNWLTIVGLAVPPIGMIMVVDYFMLAKRKEHYPVQRDYLTDALYCWAATTLIAIVIHIVYPTAGDAIPGLIIGALLRIAQQIKRTKTAAVAGELV